MGALLSKWSHTFSSCSCSCLNRKVEEESIDVRSWERKFQQMEQRIYTAEQRINTMDEANQRLYNKWTTIEDRFQQQQGDIRMLSVRHQILEQRMDTVSYEHCERLEDDIIVIEE